MARYDLSKIMKRAHNLYKNAHVKYPTFADALRKSWNMAKFEVRVAEERHAIEAETKAREAKVREENRSARHICRRNTDRLSHAVPSYYQNLAL